MSLIAIIEVNGVRVGLEQVSWEVSPNDDGMRLLAVNTTEGCGVATAKVYGTGQRTGRYFAICKWTDPNNPNHTHTGATGINLTSATCPTRTLTDNDFKWNCVSLVQPVRCNIKVQYLPDENPDPDKRRKRMVTELDNAIDRWNGETNHVKFVHEDFTLFPNVLVRDECLPNDPAAAFTNCPFTDPNNPSVIARIILNAYPMAGNCTDHENGWCDYDLPWDSPANESAIAHELGHVLGIIHDTFPKGMLMYNVDDANWFECAVNKPTFTEVVGVNAQYPGDP
jgi:hypothetical protein